MFMFQSRKIKSVDSRGIQKRNNFFKQQTNTDNNCKNGKSISFIKKSYNLWVKK